MYKLMIVEDEPLIRTGLKHYFAWEELGVHSIIEAENGREGMTTALREKPDLVITDIRMPEMDGLQMIEQIRNLLPDTLFIILTGFNDFEYAQKAIQLGNVHAFLLKPLEYEESLLVIQNCMNKLHLKRQDRLKRSNLEGAELVKLLLEEEHSVIDDAIIHELCNFNSNYYLYLPFVLTGIPVRETRTQSTLWMREYAEKFIHYAVDEYLHASTPHSIFTYSSKTKLYGLIVLGSPSSTDNFPLQTQVQIRIDQYLKALTLEHHLGLYVVISKTTENPAQIHTLLHESDRMLYQRFYMRDCRLFYVPQWIENSNSQKPSLIQLDENDKKRMISCIESSNEIETLQLMHRLAQDILSKTDVSSP